MKEVKGVKIVKKSDLPIKIGVKDKRFSSLSSRPSLPS